LAPATRLDEILEDVKDACIWVRQKGPELFNIDSQRIAVMGGSAGGMLAMAAGYIVHPHPQALVDVSGVSDLESLKKMNGDPSLLSTNDLYQMLVKKVDSQGGQDRYKTCLTRVYGSRKSWALNPNPISKDMTP
jgi:acetyl esterase/lipase